MTFTVNNTSNNDTALAELSALRGVNSLNPRQIQVLFYRYVIDLVTHALLFLKEDYLSEDIIINDF